MKKKLIIISILLVCFLGCGTLPVGVDHRDGVGDVLYRTPVPKPDCKIVNCNPPPRPGE